MTLLEEIKKIKSGEKELKEFALVMGVFFALLAGLSFWHQHTNRCIVWFVLSVAFFSARFLFLSALKPIQKSWMTLALMIGWVMSRILLSILFLLVVTPIALISRATGKKFLDLSFRTENGTYWNMREEEKGMDRLKYERQY